MDRRAYRMDFRDTPSLQFETGEVVLSPKRIEDVFGPLKPTWGEVDPAPAPKAPKKKK